MEINGNTKLTSSHERGMVCGLAVYGKTTCTNTSFPNTQQVNEI